MDALAKRISSWVETSVSGVFARRVALTNLETSVALYTPQRDYFQAWAFGADDTYETLTVNVTTLSNPLDMRAINPDMRSIVVVNEDGTAIDFDYTVYFCRDALGTDKYQVATADAQTSTPFQIDLPASLGYDFYCFLELEPELGQAGTQLNFKAYLAGRGG